MTEPAAGGRPILSRRSSIRSRRKSEAGRRTIRMPRCSRRDGRRPIQLPSSKAGRKWRRQPSGVGEARRCFTYSLAEEGAFEFDRLRFETHFPSLSRFRTRRLGAFSSPKRLNELIVRYRPPHPTRWHSTSRNRVFARNGLTETKALIIRISPLSFMSSISSLRESRPLVGDHISPL